MSARKPLLWCYVNDDTCLALVRGREARRICRLFEPSISPLPGSVIPPEKRRAVWRAEWSPGTRGWVVPAYVVVDLVAYAESVHEYVVVSRKDPPAARRAA